MSDFSLFMYAGTDDDFLATITRNSAPVNLAGAAIEFRAELAVPDASAPVQSITKSLGSGISIQGASTDGLALITFVAADTQAITQKTTFQCILDLTESNGRHTCLAVGDLHVTPHV